MPINNLTLSNTFGQWVSATQELITFSNYLTGQSVFNTNSTIVISEGGTLNVHNTALVNTLVSNTINVRTINVTGSGESLNVANSANVRGNLFIGQNVSIGNLVVRGSYTIDNPSITNLVIPGYGNIGANLNVASYIVQTGTQQSSFAGRLNLNNTDISLTASGNVTVSKNVSVTQNVVIGANLVATRIFGTTANITSLNVNTMNVSSNLNVLGTINTAFINVSSNLTVQNLTVLGNVVTQSTTNVAAGNINVTEIVNTKNLIISGSVIGNLNISGGNVVISQPRNISPGALGNGQFRILAPDYTGYIALDGTAMRVGHNVSTRNLMLEVDETPVLNASSTGIIIPGNFTVLGSLAGDAAGLTNVNYIASSDSSSSSLIFDGISSIGGTSSGRTPNWISSGLSLSTTIPVGIDTVDLSLSASILIESIGIHGYTYGIAAGGPVSVSGNFGTTGGSGTFNATSISTIMSADIAAGAGAPDMRYRVLRNGTVFYTSEWTQLSTPGSFFGLLNTVRDNAPITGSSTTYSVEMQWRNVEDIADATAGTVSMTKDYYDIEGTGTNFQAYLSARQRIVVDGVTYPITEVVYPTKLRSEKFAAATFTNRPYTIADPFTVPRLRMIRKAINLTGYRT